MLLFRDELYRRLHGGPGFKGGSEGAVVDVKEDLPKGGRTRVAMRGTEWDAVNVGNNRDRGWRTGARRQDVQH